MKYWVNEGIHEWISIMIWCDKYMKMVMLYSAWWNVIMDECMNKCKIGWKQWVQRTNEINEYSKLILFSIKWLCLHDG